MIRRTRLTLAAAGVCTLLAVSAVCLVAAKPEPQAASTSPAYDAEYEKARQQLQRHEYFEALKGFQRANRLAGGQSGEAFLGMAQATVGMKVFKNALESAQSAVDFAGSDNRLRTRAHKIKAQIFNAMGELRDAEIEYRAAIDTDPDSHIADLHYELGKVLLALHRDEEGLAELRKEIELRPHGTSADEARALIDHPGVNRGERAPDFSIVAAGGQTFSLDSLRGKIVLLDFWASWCDPCRRALPTVKRVHQEHAADPFVILGISADHNELAWKLFTGTNRMVWPQYWDRDRSLRRAYDVDAIPSYVLIDATGIELMRVRGTPFDASRNLLTEIDRQIKLIKVPAGPASPRP